MQLTTDGHRTKVCCCYCVIRTEIPQIEDPTRNKVLDYGSNFESVQVFDEKLRKNSQGDCFNILYHNVDWR